MDLRLRRDLGDDRGGIDPEQSGDLDELRDFETAGAAFVIGDEGLGPAEPVGEVGLAKAALSARLVEAPAKLVGRALAARGGLRSRRGRLAIEADELPRQPFELDAQTLQSVLFPVTHARNAPR